MSALVLSDRSVSSLDRRLPLLALGLLVVFFLAEPMRWNFSASETFNFVDSEETTLERIEGNIVAHQEGKAGRKISMLLLAGCGFWALSRRAPYQPTIRTPQAWLMLVFLVWCCLSVTWSVTPGITVRRLIVLLSMSGAALGIASQFSLQKMAWITFWATGLFAGLGLSSELVLGTFHPWEEEYRFAGLTWPAFTCWNLSLFIISGLICNRQRRIPFCKLLLTAAFVLVLLTKTRAGAGALLVAVMFYGAVTWTFATQTALVILASFCAASGLLYAAFQGMDLYAMLFGAVNLGREESVTDISGRAGVWLALLPYILQRPLWGYGYESFWTPNHLIAIGEDNWGAPDAHNGYINLALGAGLIGTLLYVAIMVSTVMRARRRYEESRDAGYLFATCVMVITMINALCVATQLGPFLMSFTCMLVLAQVGCVLPSSFRQSPAEPIQDGNETVEDSTRPLSLTGIPSS